MKTVIIWYFLRIYQINPNKRSRKLCFFLPQKGRRALLVIMCFPSLKLSHLHSCPQLQIGKIGKYENAFDNVTRNPNPMSLIPFTDTTDEMWNFTFKAQMLNFHTFDIEHICFCRFWIMEIININLVPTSKKDGNGFFQQNANGR